MDGASNISKSKRVKFNKAEANTPSKSDKKMIKTEKKKSLSCSHTYLPNPNEIKFKSDNIQRSNTVNPSVFTYNPLPSYTAQASSFNNYIFTPQLSYYPYYNFYQDTGFYSQPGYSIDISNSLCNNSNIKQNFPKYDITKQSIDSSSTLHSDKGNSYSSLVYTSQKTASSKSKLLSLINKDFDEEVDY